MENVAVILFKLRLRYNCRKSLNFFKNGQNHICRNQAQFMLIKIKVI